MDDILEKITINIDSDYATFIDESEFYVDIIDDIKNCIYIKTLKTEIFVKPDPEVSSVQYTEPSIFDSGTDNIKRHVFNIGDYLYVSLNDIKRVNTIAKTTTIMTFNDIKTDAIIGKDKDNNNIYDSDFGLKWTEVQHDSSYEGALDNWDGNSLNKFAFLGDADILLFITIINNKIKEGGTETFNFNIQYGDWSVYIGGGTTNEYNDFIKKIRSYLSEDTYYVYDTAALAPRTFVVGNIGYTAENEKITKYLWNKKNKNPDGGVNKYVFNKGGRLRNASNKVQNYKVKKTDFNTLKYYDSIYIDMPKIYSNELSDDFTNFLSYKQELTGTSCGPNDTNTVVLNPILPELKRFNIKLWKIDEFGNHVTIPITQTDSGVFRVIMSFTIYYKRKKETRV